MAESDPTKCAESSATAKLAYQTPSWTTLGTLAELTKGSAGPYIELDEFPSQTP